MTKFICQAEDDLGIVCNKEMSKQEYEQDGMCSNCADSIWANVTYPYIPFIREKQRQDG